MPAKKKIAVLGGGVGGLSAAFHLTEQQDWEDEYDITVYQMGWRAGGKCASGRDQRPGYGIRIYEHGLHLFGGFYHHAFDTLTKAYAALERSEDHPNATVWDAFTGLDAITFMEEVKDEQGRVHHMPWYINMEPNALVPGTETHSPTILQMAQAMAAKLFQFQPQAGGEKGGDIPIDDVPEEHEGLLEKLFEAPFDIVEKVEQEIMEAVAELGAYVVMRTLVRSIEKRLEKMCEDEPPAGSQAIRNFLNIAFLVQAVITGIIEDDILRKGWNSIDDEEFSDWIKRHACTVARDIKKEDDPYDRAQELVDWAAVRAIYDYVFGYLDGDTQKRALGAGTGMRGILRLALTYRGHLFYAMRGGMGDVVIAPLYLALKKRGVKFKFFNRVMALRPNADERTIDSIEIYEQAQIVGGGEYDPLIDVPVAGWDLPLECWPEDPQWDQLVDGDKLKGTNFEWTLGPQPLPNKTLQRGTDFDEIVLAIPVGALHTICADLYAQRERWKLMLDSLKTVPTLAMQLWFRRVTDDLGALPGRTQTAIIQPFSTWADMTHVLTREHWTGDERPLSLGYFCGQMPPEMPRDHTATQLVGEAAKRWLATTAPLLWKRAAKPGHGLDYNLLFDPRGGSGGNKMEGQYWRANVCPSDQYVLSVPGTLDARMRSEQSGYANLFLAGDWTRNGLNAGAAEAAAMSGLQCANAMRGDLTPVHGESDLA